MMEIINFEEYLNELKHMTPAEAGRIIVKKFWEVPKEEQAYRLLELYVEKKSECKSNEELLETALTLYDEYRASGNMLALRLSRIIIREVFPDML